MIPPALAGGVSWYNKKPALVRGAGKFCFIKIYSLAPGQTLACSALNLTNFSSASSALEIAP